MKKKTIQTRKTDDLIYVQSIHKNTYDIQEQTPITKLKAPDFGHAHIECGGVKHFFLGAQPSPDLR